MATTGSLVGLVSQTAVNWGLDKDPTALEIRGPVRKFAEFDVSKISMG